MAGAGTSAAGASTSATSARVTGHARVAGGAPGASGTLHALTQGLDRHCGRQRTLSASIPSNSPQPAAQNISKDQRSTRLESFGTTEDKMQIEK